MDLSIEVPTPAALADLIARCTQIDRYATQLAAAEEIRIAALATGIIAMRRVLELEPVARETLPSRHLRAEHFVLTSRSVEEARTPAVKAVNGTLVLDEHGQVKILSGRTWRGMWRNVTLWRDGVEGLSAADLMDFLARLVALAHERAPDAARALLERRDRLAETLSIRASGPRGRVD
jgi:hypothetical protein